MTPKQVSDGKRVQIRVTEAQRRAWQSEANAWAGVARGAQLGPWIRAMVERARAQEGSK